MTTMPMREQNARRFLGIAATLGVIGVAMNLTPDGGTLPKLIAGAGIITLVWSIHRFGRLGPDEAIVYEELEAEPAPKKKKKKKKKRESVAEGSEVASSNEPAEPNDSAATNKPEAVDDEPERN